MCLKELLQVAAIAIIQDGAKALARELEDVAEANDTRVRQLLLDLTLPRRVPHISRLSHNTHKLASR